MFDLRPEKATRRMRYLMILFLGSGFLISLRFYPPALWGQYLRDIFWYLLSPGFAASYNGNPLINFSALVLQVFTDPRIFQYLPVLLAPFFIALQCAALYLADIFELEHVSVARQFIGAVALSGSEELIRVSKGEVPDSYRLSPAYLIGGPGKVVVDLDSVALFEKPDGTPHIIGPTTKEPHGRATLEGFERFRQAIDIRDHYAYLRDQDSNSESVKSRSLDGIPVEATDVRLVFSIYRDKDGKKSDPEHPYPFSAKAVEHLIYKATSKVTPGQSNPSYYEFSWTDNMTRLIRGQLSGFMSQHKLTAYLASIGKPELEKLDQREKIMGEQKSNQSEPEEENFLSPKQQKSLPEFQPRYKIKNLFSQFAEEFTQKAHSSGVELHWIGVGTWKIPVEIVPETKVVPEEHLEAWKLSSENVYRENPEVLDKLEKEAIMQKTVALIQDVPIAAHQKAKSDEKEHEKVMKSLLLSYRQQLVEAADFMRAKGEAVPPNIEDSITHINNLFGHFL
jgi:hypothetical protein